MYRYLSILWLATTWLGYGVHGFAADPGAHATPLEVRTGGNSVQPRGNPLWDIPIDSLTATRDRPIFSPSRRPPPPIPPTPVALPPAPPPSAGPEQLPLQLLGTIIGGENGIAICLNQSTNDVIYVRMGESFAGWTLRSVHAREAAFEKASQYTVLTLPSPHDSPSVLLPLAPVAGATPPASTSIPPAHAPASGTWMDGDGQLIAPPPRPATGPSPQTWMDGDGQLIAPPKSR